MQAFSFQKEIREDSKEIVDQIKTKTQQENTEPRRSRSASLGGIAWTSPALLLQFCCLQHSLLSWLPYLLSAFLGKCLTVLTSPKSWCLHCKLGFSFTRLLQESDPVLHSPALVGFWNLCVSFSDFVTLACILHACKDSAVKTVVPTFCSHHGYRVLCTLVAGPEKGRPLVMLSSRQCLSSALSSGSLISDEFTVSQAEALDGQVLLSMHLSCCSSEK